MSDNLRELAAKLPAAKLCEKLDKIATQLVHDGDAERATLIHEAVLRLTETQTQVLVTCPDGRQVGIFPGNEIRLRSRASDSWALTLDQAQRPHEPNTYYLGQW